jgi:hypothetical protein
VVVVTPERTTLAIARRIHEPVLGRGVENSSERRIRVVLPDGHASVVRLERAHGGSQLGVEVLDHGGLGRRARFALRDHERRAVDGRDVDEEEVAGALVVELLDLEEVAVDQGTVERALVGVLPERVSDVVDAELKRTVRAELYVTLCRYLPRTRKWS